MTAVYVKFQSSDHITIEAKTPETVRDSTGIANSAANRPLDHFVVLWPSGLGKIAPAPDFSARSLAGADVYAADTGKTVISNTFGLLIICVSVISSLSTKLWSMLIRDVFSYQSCIFLSPYFLQVFGQLLRLCWFRTGYLLSHGPFFSYYRSQVNSEHRHVLDVDISRSCGLLRWLAMISRRVCNGVSPNPFAVTFMTFIRCH